MATMPVAAQVHSGTALQRSSQIRAKAFIARPCRSGRLPRGLQLVQAAKTADGPSVAIVGVTGAVGQEFLRVMCSTAASNCAIRQLHKHNAHKLQHTCRTVACSPLLHLKALRQKCHVWLVLMAAAHRPTYRLLMLNADACRSSRSETSHTPTSKCSPLAGISEDDSVVVSTCR